MSDFQFRYMAKQTIERLNPAGVQSARRSNPNWSKAFNLLRYELRRIDARDVVIEAGYAPTQIRNDGIPYSNAKPEHHQVRISFTRNDVAMSFFQGGFNALEYNVWLIAMTLESLRAVARYGCTQSDQQYAGWAQLPPGSTPIAGGEFANVEDAMRFLSGVGDGVVLSVMPRDLDVVYRAAARRAHPDKGGSDELMAKVNRAKDFVERSAR